MGNRIQLCDLPSCLFARSMGIPGTRREQAEFGQKGFSSTRVFADHLNDQDDGVREILVQPSE